jgi:hypothetical protein
LKLFPSAKAKTAAPQWPHPLKPALCTKLGHPSRISRQSRLLRELLPESCARCLTFSFAGNRGLSRPFVGISLMLSYKIRPMAGQLLKVALTKDRIYEN